MNARIAQLLASAGAVLARRRAPRAAAFTLVEVLIAVGAVALIGVVLAAAFDVTGRTVSGGRRLASFNAYAALLERQMRQDFEAMSRRGFLVIRNELADDGADIPAHPEDTSGGRPRRIDEIMFFAEGDFLSAREPLHPDFIARANAARIYYGHGQRKPLPSSGTHLDPELSDTYYVNNARLGAPANGNPNRFPIDWTLLRHVTLLRPPSDTLAVMPNPTPFGLSLNDLEDSDVQVALQPAASSIFRSIAETEPAAYPNAIRDGSDDQHPTFASGIVDIATTSLPEIFSIVNACPDVPQDVSGAGAFASPLGDFTPYSVDQEILLRMQSWMLDALPTYSGEPDLEQHRGTNNGVPSRIRYETGPTNYLEVLATYADEELAYRRADQLMLASSNFLPNCTEFIVEWSFGETFPSNSAAPGNYVAGREGELVWYGMDRAGEARPYGWGDNWHDAGNPNSWFQQSFRRVNNTIGFHGVSPELIHGYQVTIPPSAGTPLVSMFGFVDPTFEPDTNGDGDLTDPTDAAATSLPWAWPKLIRVTVTLADPNDPSYEQTYQFVFETPGQARP